MKSIGHRYIATPFAAAALVAVLVPVPLAHAEPADYKRTGSLTLLEDDGGRLDWSHDGEWIYFDRADSAGCYELYRVEVNGTEEAELLTAGFPWASHNHGNPAEHPNGDYLVFQAAKVTSCSDSNSPGKGIDNELWLLEGVADTTAPYSFTFHQLTDGPQGVDGVLHPQFSNDGTMLFWAEAQSDLNWRLAVAPFLTGETNCGTGKQYCLGTVCRFEPEETNGLFYESHGFGPDDDWIYFSCSRGVSGSAAWDICKSDVPQTCADPGATPLTLTNGDNPEVSSWDEHAHLSPLNDAMVWITTYPHAVGEVPGADLWLMDPDGQAKEQITFFNYPETRYDDYDVIRRLDDGDSGNDISFDNAVASDSAWHPDGTRIATRIRYTDDVLCPANCGLPFTQPCPDTCLPEHIWILDLTHGEGPDLPWQVPTAEAPDSGGDGNGWEASPEGAFDHGTEWALNENGVQDRHRWYNYDFSVPSGAVIDGIEVRLDWKSDSSAWGPKLQVDLSWNEGTSWTSQKTTSTGENNFQLDILGGATDTWGRTWTSSEFTNANFRVRVRASCSNESLCNGRDYLLDWLPVRVTYH